MIFPTVQAALGPGPRDHGSSFIPIIEGLLSCHISQLLFPLQISSLTFPRWKVLPLSLPPRWPHNKGNDGCLDLSSGIQVPERHGALHWPSLWVRKRCLSPSQRHTFLDTAASSCFRGCHKGLVQRVTLGLQGCGNTAVAVPLAGSGASPAG